MGAPTRNPGNLAARQYIHSRSISMVVEVEGKTLLGSTRSRQRCKLLAPPPTFNQALDLTDPTTASSVTDRAVGASVVLPSALRPQFVDILDRKDNAIEAERFAHLTSNLQHPTVWQHIDTKLVAIIVEIEDQPLAWAAR
jgi:hypothetical protein